MTIHHDKLAYGKLAPESEEMSEEQIAKMLKLLKEEEQKKEDCGNGRNPRKDNI